MCSILGFVNFREPVGVSGSLPDEMGKTLAHRGPDQKGVYRNENISFQHNRLAVIDVEKGLQPMIADYGGSRYVIVYNGEIYNAQELRQELEQQGIRFATHCDTEVVLYSYIVWGEECSGKLNGIFAFAIYDSKKNITYLSRDRMGVKPLFYTVLGNTLVFASEIKAFFAHPEIKAEVEAEGLWQLLFFSPMRSPDNGVFKNIYEISPGYHAVYDVNGLKMSPYWSLSAYEFENSEEDAIENTKQLLLDAVKRQLVSDVPLCTLLSGGIDSSIISSIASEDLGKHSSTLSTYSFEYEKNREHFTSTMFQPQSDDDYAAYMAQYLKADHSVLTVSTKSIADLLNDAVIYRDLPGMADVDSSLLYYCKEIKKRHTVALSGECADEVFGGYPWFYRPEMLTSGYFPWIHEPFRRISLFRPEVVNPQKGFDYARQIYSDSVAACPRMKTDSVEMASSRISTWLSVNWFMTSLLERKDRMSMASGLEIRVPFADHRILEYVFNIPWDIRYKNHVEKALLRNAMGAFLPERILNRKKSPYPKTRNPEYEEIVTGILRERLADQDSTLARILKPDVLDIIRSEPDSTWYGQLMGRTQLIAWLVQLDFWFGHYKVAIV